MPCAFCIEKTIDSINHLGILREVLFAPGLAGIFTAGLVIHGGPSLNNRLLAALGQRWILLLRQSFFAAYPYANGTRPTLGSRREGKDAAKAAELIRDAERVIAMNGHCFINQKRHWKSGARWTLLFTLSAS